MTKLTPPTPDYDDPKEIYAFFGLAFYKANVLEHGVLNLAVALLIQGNLGISAADVIQLYESFDEKTFGQVVKVTKRWHSFPDAFVADLNLALKYRNHLAHHFFREHDINHMSPAGRKKMIDELIDIWIHLAKVDQVMDEYWLSAWESHGVTKEWIDKQIEADVQAMPRSV
ncbi:hypothetical protein ZRA01_22170 [Zoogloea ramigera]|uniref:Uncharacterized protein n=1 Tax=Zoogloea ramigera TaxID=350 RepID=A0A4Y4CXE6_ZOORA|nr:hypothetical protein [Zoogloea ramigera]GEC96144.1 hypothetical protein ZRA01_22170 [Zoogloea ramigera]